MLDNLVILIILILLAAVGAGTLLTIIALFMSMDDDQPYPPTYPEEKPHDIRS